MERLYGLIASSHRWFEQIMGYLTRDGHRVEKGMRQREEARKERVEERERRKREFRSNAQTWRKGRRKTILHWGLVAHWAWGSYPRDSPPRCSKLAGSV